MANHATFIVYHEVLPQNQKSYEHWLKDIIQAAAGFSGHLGVNIIQPAPGGHRYSIAVKFASSDEALAWQHSAIRKTLLEDVQDILARDEQIAISTGIDNWFITDSPVTQPPKRYKQWMLTTLVIWVLTMLVPLALQPLLNLVPFAGLFGVRHLLTAAIIVGLVIYLIMPRLSRLLTRWLHH